MQTDVEGCCCAGAVAQAGRRLSQIGGNVMRRLSQIGAPQVIPDRTLALRMMNE